MHPFPAPALIGRSIAPQAEALIARMSTPPSNARRFLINRLVRRLLDSGAWAALSGSAFYVTAAADSQAARLNWLSASYTINAGAATFTADRGFAGGSMTTGFSNYTQASHALGVWMNTNTVDNGVAIGGAVTITTLQPGVASHAARTVSGGAAAQLTGTGDVTGYTAMIRSAAGNYDVRRAGVTTNHTAAIGVYSASDIRLLSDGAGGSNTADRVAAAHAGPALSLTHIVAIEAALSEYLTAIGGA